MTPPNSISTARFGRWFAPIDAASMAFFRIAFGLLMAWEAVRFLMPLSRTGRMWIVEDYVVPQFFFKYFGFGWVRPWPGDGMIWHVVGLTVVSLMFALGFWYRFSAVMLFLGITYIFLLDQAQYLNHIYLVCLVSFLMIFIPADRWASVDWRIKRGKIAEEVPAWTLWILRFQLAVVYIFAALAKLNGDWLRGEPMRRWLLERSDIPVFGTLLTEEWVVHFFAYGGFLLDLLIVPLLLWRRTRVYALAAVVMFHLTNAIIFNIGIFPWFGIAATTLFFPPSWPRDLLGKIRGWRENIQGSSPQPAMPVPSAGLRKMTVIGLGIYIAVQLTVPLRHFLYPGTVDWTYEGHRFSWRMKLNDRRSVSEYTVTQPESNQSRVIDPKDYLSPRQYEKMGARPDMVLQFAHYLAEKHRDSPDERVIVTAKIVMSLNGRPAKVLIDSDVNLAAEPRTLGHAAWINVQELEPVAGGYEAAPAELE